MPSTTFYATGTVTVANGGTTVTGVGTAWVGKVYAGDLFTDPAQGLVARVTADAVSDTSLSINPWPGTALSADPYEILITPDTTRVQERTRQLLEALGSASNVGFDPPPGMTAEDVQAAIGEVFAEIDGAAPQVTTYTKSETDTLVANAAAGAALRGTVRAATTANIAISTALNNGDTVDGVALVTGDLVLVKNQTAPAENGVYVVGAVPARAAQFDTYNEHPGAVIVVQEGTANADSFWYCTSNKGGTLGSTAITFAQQTTSIAQFTPAGSGAPAKFEFAEQTTNGVNKVTVQVPAALPADYTFTLPPANVAFDTFIVALLNSTSAAAAQAAIGVRERLSANRTYYVRTDGSDGNSGLANTSGGAFATIQKAVDTIYTLDLNGKMVTIQLADGTYSQATNFYGPFIGATNASNVVVNGNSAAPANVIITSAGRTIYARYGAALTVQNFEVRSSADAGLMAEDVGSLITLGPGMRFGACTGPHIWTYGGGKIFSRNSYSIVGAAPCHWQSNILSAIDMSNITVTVTGTPAISNFAVATVSALVYATGITFSGSATGARYQALSGGGIFTNGGGANYLPGNSAGTATSPGWYA